MKSSGAGMPPRRPSAAARLGSQLVRLYLRFVPFRRGKWWLRRRAAAWLVARLDTGPWIRVSGVSDFEWRTLEGSEAAEDRTAALFGRLLRAGGVVLDVGANVGYYALSAAARVGPGGRVVAFEPGPAAATRLRENASLNGLTNLQVIEAAVADRPGRLCFHLSGDSEAASLFESATGAAGSVEVPVTTLDNFVKDAGLARVDLLKIDAEGAEVGILRGGRQLLAGADAPVVIVEANPVTLEAAGESVAALRAELERLGYTIAVIEGAPWRGAVVENWLATRKGHEGLRHGAT
jgi:FkbM family methyltransferase